jgi:hypothetical protein
MFLFDAIIQGTSSGNDGYDRLIPKILYYYEEPDRCSASNILYLGEGIHLATDLKNSGCSEFDLDELQQLTWLIHKIGFAAGDRKHFIKSFNKFKSLCCIENNLPISVSDNVSEAKELFSRLVSDDVSLELFKLVSCTYTGVSRYTADKPVVDLYFSYLHTQSTLELNTLGVFNERSCFGRQKTIDFRMAYLKHLLGRNSIFQTEYAIDSWEKEARQNIQRHLFQLQSYRKTNAK